MSPGQIVHLKAVISKAPFNGEAVPGIKPKPVFFLQAEQI